MLSLKTFPCCFCHAARDCLMLFQTGIHFFVVVLEEISKCTLQSTWGHEDNRVDCYKQNCFFSSDLQLLFQVAVWFWLPKRQNPQNYCLPIIIHQRGGFIMGFFCTRQKCSMKIKSFHHFPGKPFVKNQAVIIISIIWICPPHPSISESDWNLRETQHWFDYLPSYCHDSLKNRLSYVSMAEW